MGLHVSAVASRRKPGRRECGDLPRVKPSVVSLPEKSAGRSVPPGCRGLGLGGLQTGEGNPVLNCGVGGGGINMIMTGTADIHGVTPRGQALFNEVSIFYLLICSFITQNTPKS